MKATRVEGIGPAVRHADPYLLLAELNEYRDYRRPGQKPLASYAISVEVRKGHPRPKVGGLLIRSAHDNSPFFTAVASRSALDQLLRDPRVRRVQLAQALATPRRLAQSKPFNGPLLRSGRTKRCDIEQPLLGMVDNGCPFAHADLRAGLGTRVLSLWNQNVARSVLGRVPAGFGYGVEFSRQELNTLIANATGTTGSINEDLCYRLAGYAQVAPRRTHAAHSLGLLAGATQYPFRPSTVDAGAQGLIGRRASAPADIAFVQLPQELMDCVSTAAVEHHALDGFRHILRVAQKQGHKKVVISFGYESWVGARDGTSWFEQAVASLVKEAKPNIDLSFFFAAGNARDRDVHAALQGGAATTLQWLIPPGNEVPTFLEIWVPAAEGNVTIEVTPPSGTATVAIGWGQHLAAPSFQIVMNDWHGPRSKHRLILVCVAPTHGWDRRTHAPHGVWTARLRGLYAKARDIHAHLGRVEGDPNSPRRAVQTRFVGRPPLDEADRGRTLNGHACGADTNSCGVYFSGEFPCVAVSDGLQGYRPARGRPTMYSGAGPAGSKQRPDYSLPMEDGLYHPGVLSMGTRSATVWRMQGTSTAAPAAARLFAAGGPRSPPGPPDPDSGLGSVLLGA